MTTARILTDDELPAWEKQRREAIQKSIAWCEETLQRIWRDATPEIEERIYRGDYWAATQIKRSVLASARPWQDELAYYVRQMPPFLVLRSDGNLWAELNVLL